MSAPPLPMSPRNLTPGAMYSGWLRVSNAYNGTFIMCSRMTITKGLCRRIPFEEHWGDLIDAFVVHCAERIVATRNSRGLGYTSAQCAFGKSRSVSVNAIEILRRSRQSHHAGSIDCKSR